MHRCLWLIIKLFLFICIILRKDFLPTDNIIPNNILPGNKVVPGNTIVAMHIILIWRRSFTYSIRRGRCSQGCWCHRVSGWIWWRLPAAFTATSYVVLLYDIAMATVFHGVDDTKEKQRDYTHRYQSRNYGYRQCSFLVATIVGEHDETENES